MIRTDPRMAETKCTRCGGLLDGLLNGACCRCLARAVLDVALETGVESQPALRVLGSFDLLEELGRGAMGVVYRARQGGLGRDVAVKVLRADRMSRDEAVRRFRTEGAAVARLSHPNIVPVFEIGEGAGEHYLAMGLVIGPTLADVTRDGPLSPRRAATLAAKVARAVQHAHEQGVLHRDLKPANILLDHRDEPHVTDFGLARRFDAEGSTTLPGQVLGTPAYMAPEQARNFTRVGPAADIYSLGALLFHLLTGRAPFVGDSIPEILRHLEQQEPVSPRVLNPVVTPDLASVCLKCLEKDPSRRYRDAAGVAEDLERFLDGRPTVARPSGRLERMVRWSRREPVVAGLVAAATVLLLAIAVVSSLAAWRQSLARESVAAAERTARERLVQSLISVARFEQVSAGLGARDRALEAIREALRNGASGADRRLLRDEAASCLLSADFTKVLEQEAVLPSPHWYRLPLGVECAFGSNGSVQVRSAGGARFEVETKLPIGLPLLSPDGRWMAIAEGPSLYHGRMPMGGTSQQVSTGAVPAHLLPIEVRGRRPYLRFASRLGDRAPTGTGDATVGLWRVRDGRFLGRFTGEFVFFSQDSRWAVLFDPTDRGGWAIDLGAGTSIPISEAIFNVAISSDGLRAALAQKEGITIWQLPEWRLERRITGMAPSQPGGDLQFSHDSSTLAVALVEDIGDMVSVLRLVSLRDFSVTTPSLPADVIASRWAIGASAGSPGRIEGVDRLHWLRDGALLVEGVLGVMRWDPASGRGLLPCGSGLTNGLMGGSGLADLAVNPGETQAAVVGPRGLELWNWPANVLQGSWPGVHADRLRWEADQLVLVHQAGDVGKLSESWYTGSAPRGLEVLRHRPQPFESLCADPELGEAWVWVDLRGQVFRQGIGEPEPRAFGRVEGRPYPVTWTRTGWTGVRAAGNAIRWIRIERGAEGAERAVSGDADRRENENHSLWTGISGDGRLVVTASVVPTATPGSNAVTRIRILDTASWRTVREFPVEAGKSPIFQLSPDGSWLLVQGEDLGVWNIADGALLARFPLLGLVRSSTRVSRDGRWMAGELNGTVRLVQTGTWSVVREWATSDDSEFGWSLDFSPDGRYLAFQSAHRQVDIVDLATLEREVSLRFPKAIDFGSVEFGPSSGRLYLSGPEATYRLDLDGLRGGLREMDLDWR